MNAYFKVILGIMFCLVLLVGNNHAQTPQDAMYNLYVQSVVYPETFDRFIQNNRESFDRQFHTYLNCVKESIFALARAEIEICARHTDPAWRYQCTKENVAVGLYFWCVSVDSVIKGEKTWPNTYSGGIILYAKRQIVQMGVDYVSMMRMTLPTVESQLRSYLNCIR
ncbi:MAG: hypothetical protein GTN53_05960 [Candidatus Aminicenantes bacterium]|nr:hypothetical protein [Candidatus Aminicenantes bacterium]NIQ66040.1 hypothetical protein [Candidatus Aminicenantes bacterium]NIT22033.1 hypothetical protein [Candidatus Aminicenantes bacterium]